jgi:hypothetical protein
MYLLPSFYLKGHLHNLSSGTSSKVHFYWAKFCSLQCPWMWPYFPKLQFAFITFRMELICWGASPYVRRVGNWSAVSAATFRQRKWGYVFLLKACFCFCSKIQGCNQACWKICLSQQNFLKIRF